VLGDETAFRDNEIDETVLPGLTAGDLRKLGVAALAHYTGGAPQFEQHRAEEESKDIEFVKEMIAAKRTQ
jgi:hypothetical protein